MENSEISELQVSQCSEITENFSIQIWEREERTRRGSTDSVSLDIKN